MKKVVRIGTVNIGNRRASVYAEIVFEDGRLSITGVEGPLPSGNCLGGCGQIDMHSPKIVKWAKGWSQELYDRFLEVWDKWHLNDMKAGCIHQRELGWIYKEHSDPVTFQGEACPVCGYRIGSAWLKEEVPAEVISFLESLPETDKTPAWV